MQSNLTPGGNLPPQQEPESYSLEEMMRRLKERGHDEGELVVRADGTQALKVKKRKRRSNQPHKEVKKRAQQLRLIQLAIAFVVVSGLAAAIAGLLFYYNSAAYREGIRNKLAAWTAADVEMSEFSVTPTNATCASATFTWPEGNFLRRLQVAQTAAHLELASFVGKKWGGAGVVAKSGSLSFSNCVDGKPKRGKVAAETSGFPFNFSNYLCEKLSITGYAEDKNPWMSLESTEGTMIKTVKGAETRFVGGLVKIRGFHPMKLDRGTIHFESGQMNISSLRCIPVDQSFGELEIKNSIDLYGRQNSVLELSLTEFPLHVLLGEGMEAVLGGSVDTSAETASRVVSFTPGDFESFRILLGFSGCKKDPLTFKGFPFLNELSRELQDQQYANSFVFEDSAVGELTRTAKEVRLKALHLETRKQFIIKGELVLRDGEFSGQLNVGLGLALLAGPQGNAKLQKVFSKQSDGYGWCRIELSGSPVVAEDNFAELLKRSLTADAAVSQPEKTPAASSSIEKELGDE